jgi:hypothetical protein
MSPEAIIAVIGGFIAVSTVVVLTVRKLPKRVKRQVYTRKWRDIQKLCSSRSNWPQAILLADQLLNDVLRRRRKAGKTMGERMVAAQNDFSDNDAVWKAHKLAEHIRHTKKATVKEQDVKSALIAFRQAIRDLGAL